MCFEKPCDIRIWLVCSNQCKSKRNTHTHCTLWCQCCFAPWERAYSNRGVTISQPEHTSIHELNGTDMSLICGVNYKDVSYYALHISTVSALMTALA